jgi:hypothetical protein
MELLEHVCLLVRGDTVTVVDHVVLTALLPASGVASIWTSWLTLWRSALTTRRADPPAAADAFSRVRGIVPGAVLSAGEPDPQPGGVPK